MPARNEGLKVHNDDFRHAPSLFLFVYFTVKGYDEHPENRERGSCISSDCAFSVMVSRKI